jgi:hypothetical protein
MSSNFIYNSGEFDAPEPRRVNVIRLREIADQVFAHLELPASMHDRVFSKVMEVVAASIDKAPYGDGFDTWTRMVTREVSRIHAPNMRRGETET